MPKAVLSNKMYMHVTPELRADIMKALTYRLETKGHSKNKLLNVEVIKHYSFPSAELVAIPIGREDLIPAGYEIIDKRVQEEIDFPLPLIPLRPEQQEYLDIWEDSGMLNALVGWGKSYTALWIAFKLRQKTLIVVHNTMLRDQWVDDIKKMFGIAPGTIGSGKFDIDSAIVVGNVQSVTKHAQALSDKFGTLILDEAHHVSATTFGSIIAASKARYKIGLTGTKERKDLKHVLFKDIFGPIIHSPPQSNTLNPNIRIIKSPWQLNQGECWANKITQLLNDEDYQDFIAFLAKSEQ